MKRKPRASAGRFSHLRLFLIILAVVFVGEAGVMLLLPALLPGEGNMWIEALVDAWLLTILLAPLFWWLIVSPLRRLADGRAHLLLQVMSAQEDERRRISRDLHDEIGQSLTALLAGLSTVEGSPTLAAAKERAGQMRQIAAQTYDEVRRLARGLRPTVLDDLGLGPALTRLAEDYEQLHGLGIKVQVADLDHSRLPEAQETALYRIVQEALTNVAKHARAKQVQIRVARHPSFVEMTVTDDGCGFDPDAQDPAVPASASFGLASMRERAALLDGSVSIQSSPARGTTVAVRIPAVERPHEEDAHSHCR